MERALLEQIPTRCVNRREIHGWDWKWRATKPIRRSAPVPRRSNRRPHEDSGKFRRPAALHLLRPRTGALRARHSQSHPKSTPAKCPVGATVGHEGGQHIMKSLTQEFGRSILAGAIVLLSPGGGSQFYRLMKPQFSAVPFQFVLVRAVEAPKLRRSHEKLDCIALAHGFVVPGRGRMDREDGCLRVGAKVATRCIEFPASP